MPNASIEAVEAQLAKLRVPLTAIEMAELALATKSDPHIHMLARRALYELTEHRTRCKPTEADHA